MHDGQFDHLEVIDRQLFVPGRDRPRFLEPTDTPFDDIPSAIVIGMAPVGSTTPLWRHPTTFRDDRLHAMAAEPGADARRIIGTVTGQTRGPLAWTFPGTVDANRTYDRFKRRRLVRLAGGEDDVERDAGAVGDEMEFRAVSTT